MNRAVAANSNTAKYFNEFYVFIETWMNHEVHIIIVVDFTIVWLVQNVCLIEQTKDFSWFRTCPIRCSMCQGHHCTGNEQVPPIKTSSSVVEVVKLMPWRQAKSPLKIPSWSGGKMSSSHIFYNWHPPDQVGNFKGDLACLQGINLTTSTTEDDVFMGGTCSLPVWWCPWHMEHLTIHAVRNWGRETSMSNVKCTGNNQVPSIKTSSSVLEVVKLMPWRQATSPLKFPSWSGGCQL